MIQQESFVCTGDLIPDNNQLGMPETKLPTRNPRDWTSTIKIQDLIVTVKLEGPVDCTNTNPDVIRDWAIRDAQDLAELWLSIINFVEGASYSVRISRIVDSIGRTRTVSPKPRLFSRGGDLQFPDREVLAGRVTRLAITNEHFRMALLYCGTALNLTPYSPFYM